jgi:mannose-1-phosphate guanylyltransferase
MTAAMVLCAGYGTRLRPLTDELAKPLMPVGDRPVLGHVIEMLAGAGVERVVVNTHHRAPDFDRDVEVLSPNVQVVHESRILGTAGGLSNAANALGAGDVVVWNGDIIAADLDLTAVIKNRPLSGAEALWVVAPLPLGAGTVGLNVEGDIVRLRGERFGREVSGADFLGIQVMSAELRAKLPQEGCLVTDVALPLLRRAGRIATFSFRGDWDDVGTPEALLRANFRWLDRRGLAAWCAADARLDGEVRLERSLVGAGSAIRGAGIVRESVVFPGAELRAPNERAIAARRATLVVPKEAKG